MEGGEQRIEVEHIQSGERTLTTSVDATLTWIEAHDGATTGGDSRVDLMNGRPATRRAATSQRSCPPGEDGDDCQIQKSSDLSTDLSAGASQKY
jgi:hypothetical protein